MSKKLDELTISGDVHAPCQRGSVVIKLSNCLLCGHEKPDDITVLSEETQPIVHSLGPPEGTEGTVYELECGACGGRYNLGVISRCSRRPRAARPRYRQSFMPTKKQDGNGPGSGIIDRGKEL